MSLKKNFKIEKFLKIQNFLYRYLAPATYIFNAAYQEISEKENRDLENFLTQYFQEISIFLTSNFVGK